MRINRIYKYIKNYYNDRFKIVTIPHNEFKLYNSIIIFLLRIAIKIMFFLFILRVIFFNMFTICLTFILLIIYLKYIAKYINKFRYIRRLKNNERNE